MATASETEAVAEQLKRLRPYAGSWTLAQDTALAKVLQDFSTRLESRTRSVEALVEDFGAQIARAEVRLSNASNELNMLSRSQFLEHRADLRNSQTTHAAFEAIQLIRQLSSHKRKIFHALLNAAR